MLHNTNYMTKPTKSLIIDEETNKLLTEIAKKEDRSQSSVMRQAIRLYAKRHQNQ